ncbi:MAG: chitobiase/beta-hexosaminidase C-terminal domain-containing protein [Bacteroidales bacterium]|nr:chitobiase/beta-hexosaminidase C-terminal domain-containing protein [Bacteroidales bacterium]
MKVLKPLLLFTLSLFITNMSLAQEQLKHKKKIYSSPEGKLFINKDLPVYFWITTSAEDKEAQPFLLSPAKNSKKYANPMYLDTEGYNTFRSPYQVDPVTKKIVSPRQDIIYEMYADSKAPKSKFIFGSKKYYKEKDVFFFGEKINLSIKSFDELSGVQAIYYSINESPYLKLDKTVELNNETLYNIKFYSVDNVGNVEKPKHIKIKIDLTTPTSKLEIDKDLHENIISIRSKILLKANDFNSSVKTIFYSIDNNSSKKYTTPITVSNLTEGEHTISYYAIDNTGNKEPSQKYLFYLDKSAPVVVDELIGNTFIANGREYSSGRSKVKLTTVDNKAGIKEVSYSINKGKFIKYTQPFYLKKSGKLEILVSAVDNVNNKKTIRIMSNRDNIPYVDLSGPILEHKFIGAKYTFKGTTFITRNTQINLKAKDLASGFKRLEYSINNTGIKNYKTPFKVETEGIHQILYSGYDFVDNLSTKTFSFVEDNTGPEIFHRFSIQSDNTKNIKNKIFPSFPQHTVLFLSSTDKLVGFDKLQYSINGNSFKPYAGLIKGFVKNKLYSIKVKSLDKLGNKNEKIIEFYIE